ncbi:hypothetical protein D3C84_1155310 [compost metagenome]
MPDASSAYLMGASASSTSVFAFLMRRSTQDSTTPRSSARSLSRLALDLSMMSGFAPRFSFPMALSASVAVWLILTPPFLIGA